MPYLGPSVRPFLIERLFVLLYKFIFLASKQKRKERYMWFYLSTRLTKSYRAQKITIAWQKSVSWKAWFYNAWKLNVCWNFYCFYLPKRSDRKKQTILLLHLFTCWYILGHVKREFLCLEISSLLQNSLQIYNARNKSFSTEAPRDPTTKARLNLLNLVTHQAPRCCLIMLPERTDRWVLGVKLMTTYFNSWSVIVETINQI